MRKYLSFYFVHGGIRLNKSHQEGLSRDPTFVNSLPPSLACFHIFPRLGSRIEIIDFSFRRLMF